LANDVLVLAEQKNGELDNIVPELLAKGREIADSRNGRLGILVIGHDIAPLTKTLAGSGVDCVLVADDTACRDYHPQVYRQIILSVVKDFKPDFLLFGYLCLGIEMGPSVAAALGVHLASNSATIDVTDGKVTITRPMYSGTLHVREELTGPPPHIITFQKGVLPRTVLPPRPATVTKVPVVTDGLELLSRVIGIRQPAVGEVDLGQAEIIVALGRAIGDPANIQLGRDLADALGGVVGCSRHLADKGWLPPECHIGMEGKTVAPKVYIACGISGASHHVGGIRDSDMIIAINKDTNAPIFAIANYGVVGDLFKIVPALTAAARKLRASS